MHMNLSVMLVAKQNTQITTYILRMGRLSMGLCKSSGARLRICCLMLFRLLLVHQSIRNPSVFGKVMQISYFLIIAALALYILPLERFPFCFFFFSWYLFHDMDVCSNACPSSSFPESFLAATRELQRIYGKDEVKQLS